MEAARPALSDDLRRWVIEAVTLGGLSCHAATERFAVSVFSRRPPGFAEAGGDRRSRGAEAHREHMQGSIRRTPDIGLLQMRERLSGNCGERFA